MNSRKRMLTATITVRVAPRLKRKLIKIAKAKSMDTGELVRDVLEDYINKTYDIVIESKLKKNEDNKE